MADEPKGPGPLGDLLFIIGVIVVLAAVWIAQGAKYGDLKGIFIRPPEPVGQGGSYGPQIGQSASTTQVQVHY
ncbi:MAG: hypothetical protein KGH79_01765 [Patescibacteria group bacterium]|nr:hypothetical protein [Patescibacteria group bacterium]